MLKANAGTRAKELENQIAQLESESDRLSQALESQKTSNLDAELATRRKLEELRKDLSAKVCRCSHSDVFESIETHRNL